MIPSRFNISVPDFPGNGKHLLFNTLSQAQVVIDNELRDVIRALPATPSKPETLQALSQLIKMGFLVPCADDDTKSLEAFFSRASSDNRVLVPTVLTTYACNFACTYCVEKGVHQGVPMTEKSAERTADYIIAKFTELGSREIALAFYGGEPLLNLSAVRTVARRLKDFTDANHVPFGFSFSTNGALLARSVVEELTPLGMAGAKITLDGPRDAHDRNRPFRNGSGSFDLLLENIRAIVDLTGVSIEINFNGDNKDRVGELLDLLCSLGLNTKIKRLLFCPISAIPKDREDALPAVEIPCNLMTLESSRQLMELQALAVEKGFPVSTSVIGHVCEMVSKPSHFLIDPGGDLYRCGAFAGRKEFSIGTIGGQEHDLWLGKQLWKRCVDCAYAPQCGDGCPFGAYVRYGDSLQFNCGKESMEYLVHESLKLSYLQKNRKQAR